MMKEKVINKYKTLKKLQEENERLKEKLNCKEYFSSTMPKDTEFVILTKNNYDRQQKDIQLELIDYKLRVEKAVELIKNKLSFETYQHLKKLYDDIDSIEEIWEDYEFEDLLNILQNGSDENE